MTFSTAALAASVTAAGAFEGADLASTPEDRLVKAQDAVARVRKMADALLVEIAGEIARRSTRDDGVNGFSRKQGFSSPGRMLADTLGGSEAEANRILKVAEVTQPTLTPDGEPDAGPRFPALANAVTRGELSTEVAALLTRALERIERVAPDTMADLERRMVAKAVTLSLADVRRMLSSEEAKHRPVDLEERDRAAFDNRYIQIKDEADGSVGIYGRLDAVTAAPIVVVLRNAVKRVMQARRDSAKDKGLVGLDMSVDDRSPGQIHADALSSFAHHVLGCEQVPTGATTTIVLRVNEADLREGTGCASIDDIDAKISVASAQRLATRATILPMLFTGNGLPLKVGRRWRRFTKAQVLALAERDGGCSWCHAPPSFCEAHHITWWSRGGTTNIDNGVMLCVSCHHRIHAHGWEIEVKDEHVWFTPPASVDPARTPRIGGRAHYELETAT